MVAAPARHGFEVTTQNSRASGARNACLALAVVTFAALSSAAAENAPIGFIKVVSGTATVTRNASTTAATLAMPVYQYDRLQTGPEGSLGVTFRDNTRIALGPDSRIELRNFVFEPAAKRYGFILRLAYGTLEYISGLTEKLAPAAMSIATPGFTVGARGTRFLVRAEGRQ
jgi:hypothetical protein